LQLPKENADGQSHGNHTDEHTGGGEAAL
jgi:hypothetical protein